MNAGPALEYPTAPLLFDAVLPETRYSRLECVMIPAAPQVTYAATRSLDLLSVHSPLFDMVTWARGVPDRLRHRPAPVLPSLRVADLFDTPGTEGRAQPWVALAENPGREIVFGAVAKVWRPVIEWHRTESAEFARFTEPGWAKTAAAFVVHPYGTDRSLLTYEARTVCTDPESTARFSRYWGLVSPGVGIVLRATLRTVRSSAVRAARRPPARPSG
ncbi:hypothetical protein [Streptomyces sp. GC420]|uniref:hypothetical protein n=1 Tax=Streptomyces sp. GC420 TaxID=2697568 RepID=UPI00141517A3|nr:hypothetical protein [Streptomyces sp. GC420]NBM18720.1 hypothetical protein [Streptomyces sp. GC420]